MREELPAKNIWVYSGYLYEDFQPGGRACCQVSAEFLSLCDVLVDGPFLEDQKNLMLSFRGSENQRIIDLRKTQATGTVTELFLDRK